MHLRVFLNTRLLPSIFLATGVIGLGSLRVSGYLSQVPNCPIKAVIGVDCPACGTSRCLSALAHGDLSQAIDQNLLAFVLILGSFLVAIVWLFKGPNFRANFKWVKVLTCVTVFTGLFWLARMIPWQIGEWLISGTYH